MSDESYEEEMESNAEGEEEEQSNEEEQEDEPETQNQTGPGIISSINDDLDDLSLSLSLNFPSFTSTSYNPIQSFGPTQSQLTTYQSQLLNTQKQIRPNQIDPRFAPTYNRIKDSSIQRIDNRNTSLRETRELGVQTTERGDDFIRRKNEQGSPFSNRRRKDREVERVDPGDSYEVGEEEDLEKKVSFSKKSGVKSIQSRKSKKMKDEPVKMYKKSIHDLYKRNQKPGEVEK